MVMKDKDPWCRLDIQYGGVVGEELTPVTGVCVDGPLKGKKVPVWRGCRDVWINGMDGHAWHYHVKWFMENGAEIAYLQAWTIHVGLN